MNEKPLEVQRIEPLSGSLVGEVLLCRGQQEVTHNVLVTVSGPTGVKTVLITPERVVETSPKHFVETPKERVLTAWDRWAKRFSSTLSAFGYAIAATLLIFSVASAAGYVKARVVLTNSMEPSISPGDVVITVDSNRIVPELGSVVSYQARQFDGTPVGIFTHRIIGGDAVQGWLLKGDNNPSPDIQKPKGEDILGTVVTTIPYLGYIFDRRLLFTLIPLLLGLWFLLDVFKRRTDD